MTLPGVPALLSLATGLPEALSRVLRAVFSAQDGYNAGLSQYLKALPTWTWQRPTTFSANWVDFDSSNYARYTLLPCGLVVMDGLIKSGTIGSAAFTLPVALRPGIMNLNVAADSNAAHGRLAIQTGGSVVPAAGSNVYFSLCAVWLPAQVT